MRPAAALAARVLLVLLLAALAGDAALALGDVSPAGAYAKQQAEDDGGPDILEIAAITAASIGGAAAVMTLLYLLRRSIGFDLHRPPEGDEEGPGD